MNVFFFAFLKLLMLIRITEQIKHRQELSGKPLSAF